MNTNLFKNRNFFLLMQGSMASQFGTMMQTFALSLYVLNHYESTTLFASILIVSAIPRLLLGPFAGVLVDWFDRKKIIVRLDILSGTCVLLMFGLFSVLGYIPLWSIYAITMTLSLISTLFTPAVNTVIPNIMKSTELLEANSMNQMLITLCSLLAPLLAGVLMSFSHIGWILLFNGVSFYVSAISEYFIEIPKTHKMPAKVNKEIFISDFTEGITLIKDSRFLLLIALISLVLNFALTPVFSVGIPHILKKVMIVKDFEYGLVNTIIGSAALVASVITAKYGKRFTVNRILRVDLIAQPLTVGIITGLSSYLFMSLFDSYYLPLVLFTMTSFVFVVILTVGNITINTMIQKIVPKNMLGRVSTVIGTLCGAAIPIGQGLYGLLVDKYNHVMPMIVCTGILIGVAVVSINIMNHDKKIDLVAIEKLYVG